MQSDSRPIPRGPLSRHLPAPRSVLPLIPVPRCRIWADSRPAAEGASRMEVDGTRTDSGGVAERPKAAVLKTAEGSRPPKVRILPPPHRTERESFGKVAERPKALVC